MRRLLALLIALSVTPFVRAEDKVVAPAPGATVPDFTLKDVHRRPRSLANYKDRKAVVVVFADTECPLANLFVPTLVALHRQYSDQGVQFLAINSSRQDSFLAVSAHAQERDIPFPVLKDFDHGVANAFGATHTPEAFVLDAGRVIRYHGRIDDQYGIGFRRDKPTRNDLKAALDEVLAGKPVTTRETRVEGCPIERAKEPRVDSPVTYSLQVARIVQKHCQECHRPGEIGPFPLLTYDDARKRAARIRSAILEEQIPPWHADPHHGKFANDRRLTSAERDTLLAWIAGGTPEGDRQDMPPPRQFVAGWKVGKPDLVFTMPKDFKVPASGVLDYQRFIVDPGLKEDVWVQASECRPGNRAVVHHVVVYILAPGKGLYEPDGTAATLSGWAPGDIPVVYPEGMARKVPAGSKLLFEVHYTPNGTEQTDRSSVGVIFAKKPPAHAVNVNILANLDVRLRPNEARVKRELTYTFPDDGLVLAFMPHMHLRGVRAKYVLTRPDSKPETLLSVPDYDFGWQTYYRFAEPIKVAKGTRLTWTAEWDNSADNPRNPDASKDVRWGLQTWDEMQNGWMEVVWQKK